MEVTKSVQLDLRKNTHKIIDIFKKWDKNSRSIEFEIIQDGEQLSIPEASCTAMIAMKKPDGEPIFNYCTIENNIIKVVFTEQMLASDGIANAELRIYDSSTDSLAITSSFKMLIRDSTIDDFKIQSSYEYNALTSIILSNTKAIKKTQEATQNAIQATNTANSTVEQMNQLSSSVSEAEIARISAEEGRVSAENNRKSSETNRNLVFEEKITSINEKISAAEDATSAANEAAEKANTVASGDITSKTVTFTQGSEFALPESDETVGDIIGKTVGDLNDLNTRLRSTIESMGSGVYVSDEIAEETTFDTTLDADTLNGQPSSYYATSEDVAALNSQMSASCTIANSAAFTVASSSIDLYKHAGIVEANITLYIVSAEANKTISVGTVPDGYRPIASINIPVVLAAGTSILGYGILLINTSGDVALRTNIAVSSGAPRIATSSTTYISA